MDDDRDTDPPDLDDAAEAAVSRVGQRLGPYELVRHLGTGGMGKVYLARRADGQFEQQVAVKVMKRGMDTDFILGRFWNERQILAGLHHPNVCRLLDGGASDDGVPYFVMEHIDGEPIDGYCQWHALSVPRRLDMFLGVCDAVRYAHQNLVVHCDIKPCNVLVTADGVAKLLDFGIAKLVDQAARATGSGTRLMTPAYASPEQMRGDPVTTATDVHALGILLYQLLGGVHPFARGERSGAALARAILEEEPPPPSRVVGSKRLARELRGDLDTIVLRALSKEPARRYPSAGELAGDIDRHRRGLPVLARPDSLAYRAGKFIRRHRVAAVAAVAVFLSLIAGIATTAWQARVAQRERARAERRFEDVRHVANALVFDLHDAIADLPGSTTARKLLVERAITFLDGLAGEARGDAALQRELVEAYLKLGDVQGNAGRAHLGDFVGAQQSYQKGLAVIDAMLARDPRDLWARRQHADYLDHVGDVRWETGDMEGALDHARRALAEYEQMLVDAPGDVGTLRAIAAMRADIGDISSELDRFDEALRSYHESLALHRTLADKLPGDVRLRRNITMLMLKIGDCLFVTGDVAGAMAQYQEALAIREAALAKEPNSAAARRDVASGLVKVGNGLLKAGDPNGSLSYYLRVLEMDRAALAADPQSAEARRDYAVILYKLGNAHAAVAAKEWGDAARDAWRRAATYLREAVGIHLDMKAKAQFMARDEQTLAIVEKLLAESEEKAGR